MNKEKNLKRLFNVARNVNGNVDWVKSHIILYPEDVNCQDDKWMTFLMFAARYWNKKVVDLLKFKWANVGLTNVFWTTALMYSIMYYNQTHKDLEIIESLITEKVLNLENKEGNTPLIVAKRFKHDNVSNLLIEYGAVED